MKSSKKSKSKRRDSTRDSTASHANSPRIPRASLGFNKDDEEDDVIGAEADDAEAEYIRYSVCGCFPPFWLFWAAFLKSRDSVVVHWGVVGFQQG